MLLASASNALGIGFCPRNDVILSAIIVVPGTVNVTVVKLVLLTFLDYLDIGGGGGGGGGGEGAGALVCGGGSGGGIWGWDGVGVGATDDYLS